MDDAPALFAYRSNARVNQYQGWIPRNLGEVHEFIKHGISARIDVHDTWFQLAIVKKENKNLIGDIGIHFLDPGGYQAELGFTLSSSEQGKGFATEALTGTIDYLFNELNKHRVVASIDPRNEKSIALVVRLGFRKEAHFRKSLLVNGEWTDDLVYAMLREDWMTRCSMENPE
jgi:RimJ/RimL family protein N-acetyltransferase